MVRVRKAGLGVAAVAACLLAAGCGGGSPKPSPLKETKASPTTSTPEPTPSAAPTSTQTKGQVHHTADPGDKSQQEAAKGFVLAFVHAYDSAATSGKFGTVESMSSSGCSTCAQAIDYYKQIYAKGQKVVGGQTLQPKLFVVGGRNGSVVVTVNSTTAAYRITDKSGNTVKSSGAVPNVSTFEVKKNNGAWQVVSWSYQ